jgi:hypothetical protein
MPVAECSVCSRLEVRATAEFVCRGCRERSAGLTSRLRRSLHAHFAAGIYGLELVAVERFMTAARARSRIMRYRKP